MADTDLSLTLNKEGNFDEQIVNKDNEKFLIIQNQDDSSSTTSSYNSLYTTPPPTEGENDADSVELNDSSGCNILTRAENLRNGEGNCDLCKMKDLQVPGDFYCRYCDKCFCQDCISFHKELTPDHTVTDLLNPDTISTKDVTPVSTCDKHKLPVTLYCDECQLCLCVACWERHKTGDGQKRVTSCSSPVSLDLIATEKRTQGTGILESLVSFKEKAMKQSEFIDGIMSEMTENSERKCESLWNELEVLFTSLRHRLALLISQIHTETYCQKSKLQRKSVSLKAYLRDVENLQSKLFDLLQSANDVDLVSAFKGIESKADSLDIDKYIPMMDVCPISVGVEYSKDYLNLYRNIPNLVLGKPHLTLGSEVVDDSSNQQTLDQILTESRTDVGIQCDEKDIIQTNLISNPFFDEDGYEDLNMSESNLNLATKSCSSPPFNKRSTRNLQYLYNKHFFTQSDSGTSDHNSFQSGSLTTFSDICSPSDFGIGACASISNVASPSTNSGCCDILDGRVNSIDAREVELSQTDFSPKQMPVLKTSHQWSMSLEKDTYVRGLTVTDDDHIFVCDRSSKKVTEFDSSGKLMCRCDVSGIPWDVCAFSNSLLFVTLPQKSKLLLLQRCTGKCLLAVSLAVSTGKKKYMSLTKVNCGILACDHDVNVDLLDSNGNVLSTVLSSLDQTGLDASHRICSGQLGDTFWTLNITLKTISCHRVDGELLIYHRIAFRDTSSDICSDCYNCIYGIDKKKIYCLTKEGGENILWTFKQELKNYPRMCVNSTRDKLFVSYLSGNKNVLQIFNISPKFVSVNN